MAGTTMKPRGVTHKYLLPSQQAAKVIARFDNAHRLSLLMKQACPGVEERSRSSIIRWTYPRSRGGTDGRIPAAAWPGILKAARFVGIILTEDERTL